MGADTDQKQTAARLAWNADRAWMASQYPNYEMPAWSKAPAWQRKPYLLDPRPGTIEPPMQDDADAE